MSVWRLAYWLEKPYLHNHRSVTCVNMTFNRYDLKGRTIFKVMPLTTSIFNSGIEEWALLNRKPLAYGYENDAFQAM